MQDTFLIFWSSPKADWNVQSFHLSSLTVLHSSSVRSPAENIWPALCDSTDISQLCCSLSVARQMSARASTAAAYRSYRTKNRAPTHFIHWKSISALCIYNAIYFDLFSLKQKLTTFWLAGFFAGILLWLAANGIAQFRVRLANCELLITVRFCVRLFSENEKSRKPRFFKEFSASRLRSWADSNRRPSA